MWNLFNRKTKTTAKNKKNVKKKIVKKKPKADPLDVLNKTLDKKLMELAEKKKDSNQDNISKERSVEKKHHKTLIEKPGKVSFMKKNTIVGESKTEIGTNLELQTKSDKKNQININDVEKSIDDSKLTEGFKNTLRDIEYGLLYGAVINLKTKKLLHEISHNFYNLSGINIFIDQLLDMFKENRSLEPYLLVDMDKQSFLYLQIFEKHYFVLWLDKNEISLGHVLNILKPELIKNYYEVI